MPSGSDGHGPSKKSAKSAKAIKAAQKKSNPRGKSGGGPAPRNVPWMTIGAVAVVAALIAVLAVNLYPKYQANEEAQRWAPTADNPDPSDDIAGVTKIDYPAGIHVEPTQRVAYDHTPPFGGPHDAVWATCTGTVYPEPIRTENAVHSLEHGAVWITYDPDALSDDQREVLVDKVDGNTYMMLSPFPGQDTPISLQSWGHQLAVDSADDERVDQFVNALRLNPNTHPEVGASCSTIPGSGFDTDTPPAFDPNPPGPDAVPMDGGGIQPDPSELVPGGGGLPGGLPGGAQLPPELQQQLELPADGAPAPAGQ
ncbi:DUF3105 domain-containing protein [Rhodococcus triatomae]|uniref:DUF3105 domain-containing protein n=1 Tax=Rhodococcus triatomae TaxID=300028 RepID=A0A1G8LVT0_9NOCA|nr:DUF3105 domain-containing protein [Rhodococcus triatomae]QNG18258.1 DUF3105 domain-containing protein [Rhodococcus triatomae]QNG22071.1 DUF3105 domain-containing protein [Rhodococcus triatomae]SDI59831.1 Protein of unknown function [Rhodococcus triatomae]